ncbi:glutamate ligase domain-containing protein, partial [Glaesserella parasuis]
PQPNCATALAVLTQLPFELSDEILVQAVAEAQMTARFQLLGEQDFATFSQNRPLAQVIIDVGHNPHAARYLADRLAEWIQPNRKIYAVFSALVDKDLSGIVEPLEELIDEWHCAGLQGYRGQSGAEVKNKLLTALPNAKAVAYENVIEASQVLFETASEQDIILVFGSFH